MKKYERITGLLMATVLLAGAMTGCTTAGGDKNSLVYKAGGITPETTMLTVEGVDVSAEVYFYWLAYSCDYLTYSSENAEIDWEAMQDEETSTVDYVKNDALQTSKLYAIVAAKAKEYDCGLTEENQNDLDSMRTDFVNKFGNEAEYVKQLYNTGLTDKTFMELNSVSYLYQNLKTNLYAENGALYPTDEQLQDYADENGYMHANHILFSTIDENGESISDAEKAKKLAAAKETLAQLRASNEPMTLFDTLAKEYTDDPGYAANAEGYYFVPGGMNEDFENAVSVLDVNEISDVVETDFGYHIILRLPLDNSVLVGDYAEDNFDAKIGQWQEEAEVTYKSAYDDVDPQTFYTKLLTLREAIEAEAAAAQQSDNAGATNDPNDNQTTEPTPTAAG